MGFLEWFLNTPSHHRVHHGSNPKYIDKNHAGTLIIWDRLFGTFQKEEEEVVYGITTPLASWNPVWANIHYWLELFATFNRAKGMKEKLFVFTKSPGWFPETMGGRQIPKEININSYVKYSPEYDQRFTIYILCQFVFSLTIASILIFTAAKLNLLQLIASVILVIISLTAYGSLMEQKKWAISLEYFRFLFWILCPFVFNAEVFFIQLLIGNTSLVIFSFIWFKRLLRA